MNKNLLLILAAGLIFIGFVRPNIQIFNPVENNNNVVVNDVVIDSPSNENLKKLSTEVTRIFKDYGSDSKADALRLRDLYKDLATLIELDGNEKVLTTTEDIRQANKLSGAMLRLDIKNKYIDLASTTNAVIVEAIGLDDVALNTDLRKRAIEGFMALAWACNESTK